MILMLIMRKYNIHTSCDKTEEKYVKSAGNRFQTVFVFVIVDSVSQSIHHITVYSIYTCIQYMQYIIVHCFCVQ